MFFLQPLNRGGSLTPWPSAATSVPRASPFAADQTAPGFPFATPQSDIL